jgi:hypothetical protein
LRRMEQALGASSEERDGVNGNGNG